MEIAEQASGTVAVLALSGHLLEDGTCPPGVVSERVERLTAGGKTLVVLDLAGLDGIDAMGIGEIAGAYRRARSHGADLKLINPRPRVDRLLSVTKLRTMIDVWDLPEVEPRPPAYHPAAPGALRV